MSEGTTDAKQYFRDCIEEVRKKRDILPENSRLRLSISDNLFAALSQRIENSELHDLDTGFWPFTWILFEHCDSELLATLDSDIEAVVQATPVSKRNDVAAFLSNHESKQFGHWYGKLFDIAIKSSILKHDPNASIDFQLPNGRDVDACAVIGRRKIVFESSVLTDDVETIRVNRLWMNDRKENPNKSLVRPGPYDDPTCKRFGPYFEKRRVFLKAFDKLSRDLNPDRAQLTSGCRNVLILGCTGSVDAGSHPMRWAIDELFLTHPQSCVSQTGSEDVTLEEWLDERAHDLAKQGQLDLDAYMESYRSRLFRSAQHLSAILLFRNGQLIEARLNYNADKRLSHREMVKLECMFRQTAQYL